MSNVVTLKSGGAIAPIIPQSIEEVFRLSTGIAASGLAPKGMDKPEQITVAILTGMELGLPPMFAIQKIAVINGRPAIWGDAVPALLWSRGFKLREWMDGKTGVNRMAFCEVTRPDGTKIERVFSETDASRAGLLKKAGPWTQYPDRMLAMRARGFACRDGAPDVLSGLYLQEELEAPARDITPATNQITMRDGPGDALDIPDIPDIAQDVAQDVEEIPDDPIVDPDALLEQLASDLAACDDAETLSEVVEQYSDLLPRLPKEQRQRAAAMMKEAAE